MTLGELVGPEAKLSAAAAALPISGIAVDSRRVEPGNLFAALPGVNTDGARFAADAVTRGAVAVLAPETMDGGVMDEGVPVIAVPDPRRTLALIAARFFGAQPETMVAVTGTNGKTSVAAFTRMIWQELGVRAINLGTTGVEGDWHAPLRHTTPGPTAAIP